MHLHKDIQFRSNLLINQEVNILSLRAGGMFFKLYYLMIQL